MRNKLLLSTALIMIASTSAFAGMRGGHQGQGRSMMKADLNKDGSVSKAEATAEAPRLAVIFDAVDGDRNGLITAAEETAFKARMDAAKLAAHSKRFAKLDVNKDGSLTKDELSGRAGKRADRIFDRLDGNKDGKISSQEFNEHRGKRGMAGRGHGGQGKPSK